MTDESKEDGERGDLISADGVDGYKVGNKRPPLHSRFRPGQSGNPKGRPTKARNLKSDLIDELSERIPIREGDRRRRVSKQQALLKAAVKEGLSGDVRAISWVFGLVARLVDNVASTDEALDVSDLEIIESSIARRLASQNNGKKPPSPRRDEPGEKH